MRYVIEKKAAEPAYLQLYRQLRQDILQGVYPYGTKLPSKRTIAMETELSTITVEHAYGLLCDEGYAEARERSGYFVVFRTDDGFAAAPSEGLQFFRSASQTQESAFPVSVLAKTMRRVINDLEQFIQLVINAAAQCPGCEGVYR